ncbi:probable transcriptional regulatory protein TTE1135 [Chelonus insularis]|uniref:probable transcriptional regulatory protein TTE1135 n=1 Tax=Chelonus insularis TaxID=460826 RepID=UPI00158AD5E9|nr:probable transcriptional regulatory protein TTE1135 [Chelonus insularis]
MYKLTRFSVKKITKELITQDKKFKGHSKWQNIRHIKAEKDAEKAAMIINLCRRIKVAIAEGGSLKPSDNPRLQAVLKEARRKNMPAATIDKFLNRIENSKVKTEIIDCRGPGKSVFLIKILTENPKGVRMEFNTIFRKAGCINGDGKLVSMFNHYGYIITEMKDNLDVAIEDAIAVGADEVEIIEDKGKYYEFACNPIMMPRIQTQLEKLNYKIITFDDLYVPRATITLSKEENEKVNHLYTKLDIRDEIVNIYHNIEYPEEDEKSTKSK